MIHLDFAGFRHIPQGLSTQCVPWIWCDEWCILGGTQFIAYPWASVDGKEFHIIFYKSCYESRMSILIIRVL